MSSETIASPTCSRCHRGSRDNFERVQIARERLCMRPRCKPSLALEQYPLPAHRRPEGAPERGAR